MPIVKVLKMVVSVVIIMIRTTIGFLLLMIAGAILSEHGNLWVSLTIAIVGLSIFSWPILTGYYSVTPESHYKKYRQW